MQNNSLQVLSKFAFKKKSLLFPSKTISSFSQGERGRGEGKGGHVEWYQYKLRYINEKVNLDLGLPQVARVMSR